MANVAIYYQKYHKQDNEQAVFLINKLIKKLETNHVIKGVFMEQFNENFEIIELLSYPLSELDYLYINKPLENEFDTKLFNLLSKTQQIKIRFFEDK